jgi:acetyl esterase/lipase
MRKIYKILFITTIISLNISALCLYITPEYYYFFAFGVVAQEWFPWYSVVGLTCIIGAYLARKTLSKRVTLVFMMFSFLPVLAVLYIVTLSLTSTPSFATNIYSLQNLKPSNFSLPLFFDGYPKGRLQYNDVVYTEIDGSKLTFDVYTPVNSAPAKAPAIIIVHGGAWRWGDKYELQSSNEMFAGRGFVVFSIDYRLSPDARFPAPIEDTKCAIGFIKTHAKDYNIDASRLILMGRSSGGQIALVAAYSQNSEVFVPSCKVTDTTVSAVVAYYPPVSLDVGYKPPEAETLYSRLFPSLSNGAVESYLGGSPSSIPATYRLAAPVNWVDNSTPPTLIIHGKRDHFIPYQNSQLLANALAEKNRPYAIVQIPWADHGFNANVVGISNQRIQSYVDRFLEFTLQN